MTITNTFGTGQLTVEKVVTDPSGLVADGTKYTINVACTFDGKPLVGYPQDVVLTYAGDLSETLTDLPYGTECALTEPDLNGAAVSRSSPATAQCHGQDRPSPERRRHRDGHERLPGGHLPDREVRDGPASGFVPADTEFEVTATCTLPADSRSTDPDPSWRRSRTARPSSFRQG